MLRFCLVELSGFLHLRDDFAAAEALGSLELRDKLPGLCELLVVRWVLHVPGVEEGLESPELAGGEVMTEPSAPAMRQESEIAVL